MRRSALLAALALLTACTGGQDDEVEMWHRDTMGDRWWRGRCASFDERTGPGVCEADESFD